MYLPVLRSPLHVAAGSGDGSQLLKRLEDGSRLQAIEHATTGCEHGVRPAAVAVNQSRVGAAAVLPTPATQAHACRAASSEQEQRRAAAL